MIALVLVFIALLIVGAPIAFALGLASMVYVTLETQLPLMIVFQRMFTSLDSFPFMAIPFFILAGALMNASGLADQIIAFSRAIVGHLAGGLANVSIVASMLFGGVSGSAIADSSALGSILIPAMVKEGYHARFAAAVNATSSTMGIIIPPSIPMILAGVATSLSIRELFFGGLVPGLLVGVGLLFVTTIISRHRGYSRFERTPRSRCCAYDFGAIPAFLMVAIILGGILGGIFTATEASVIAVFYALLVGLLYRRLTFANVHRALVDTVTSSAVVMVVIATAGVITWLLAYSRIPQTLAAGLGTAVQSPLLLLAHPRRSRSWWQAPCSMSRRACWSSAPMLLPMVRVAGIDPIHFTVVMVFALAIGLTTPPVGTTMMISSHIGGVPVLVVARASIPYILIMVLILFALIFFPQLVLWAPQFLFRGG
jgi:C4-dicarboxylate transporter, DctM subunit